MGIWLHDLPHHASHVYSHVLSFARVRYTSTSSSTLVGCHNAIKVVSMGGMICTHSTGVEAYGRPKECRLIRTGQRQPRIRPDYSKHVREISSMIIDRYNRGGLML
eukprot:GHVO01010316.1.p1 GENE.GHVO01010316.1~~GHVO01010316.1.p1  ORF type:complete len:106 (-),score=4.86 GHVO01010316.1:185-502(-)